MEFAVSQFGTRLVIVLGHSNCGAITATIDELAKGNSSPSKNISSIVDRVKPAVESLMCTELKNDPEKLVDAAVRANVRASANQLRHGSEIIEDLVQNDDLLIVGAEYCLESGIVDFFDGVPKE